MKKKILYFDLEVHSTDFIQTLLQDQAEYEFTVINSFVLFKNIFETQTPYDLVVFHLWAEHPAIRNRFLKAIPDSFKKPLLQLSQQFEAHPEYPSLTHFEIPGDLEDFKRALHESLAEKIPEVKKSPEIPQPQAPLLRAEVPQKIPVATSH
jgi:hypothetical protein